MEFIQKKEVVHQPVWDNWLLIIWGVLSLFHLVIPINEDLQMMLFVASILLTGIPHGALDHLVEEKNREKRKMRFSMLMFLAQYFLRMAVFAIVWYFTPLISLGIFLLLSAYHFGETDLAKLSFKARGQKLFQLSYGLMILSFILLPHLEEVLPIINQLPHVRDSAALTFVIQFRLPALIAITAITLVLAWYMYKKGQSKDQLQYLGFTIQMVCIVWLVTTLPLMLAFTFYFGCWHSMHALNNIRHHLSTRPDQPLSWPTMIRKSLPFSLAALALIVAVIAWTVNTYETPVMMMGFFIGIAILTAPHLEIMSKMQRHLEE
jgi:Brp/Blh family beta-carotene 15,15'-monooxygenase